eukprot:TRINITY_DN31784_c0_g1_i1.p1 TRINITY_DN31784_c0_g1~~TRINITY_DN31784_c0_g1_i1.p1  ORF type:complete len:464 (-),score=42.60 TRINITY_DN31784_c0_g1_i1:125-1363(-)
MLACREFCRPRKKQLVRSAKVDVPSTTEPEVVRGCMFPTLRPFRIDESDMERWTNVTSRIFHVEFNPDEPLVASTSQPIPHLARLLQAVADGTSKAACEPPGCTDPIDDLSILRSLIGTNFDAQRAARLLADYSEIRRASPGLTVPQRAWVDRAIVVVPFEDVHGRPVAFGRIKAFDSKQSIELMENGFRATADGVIAHMLSKREDGLLANPLEQWVFCLDCEGIGWENLSTALGKMFMREASQRYVERIATIMILRPPKCWQFLWSFMKPMLHPRTIRKFKIVPAQQLPATMRKLVGEARADTLLPPVFGGSAPAWPAPGQGVTLDEKVGSLLAEKWRELGMDLSGAAQAKSGAAPLLKPVRSAVSTTKQRSVLLWTLQCFSPLRCLPLRPYSPRGSRCSFCFDCKKSHTG